MTIRIKNWAKFQHFKDRRPPWIKLYRDILDDPEWFDLDPVLAKYLVMFWLMASENLGTLPDIKKISFRLRISERDTAKIIYQLIQWLECDDINEISERYQLDAPEKRREETENKSFKDDGEEQRRQASKSEIQIRESFQKLTGFLRHKFPLLDLEFEETQCVAKYQNKPPCTDPDVRVMEWCKRAKPPEKQPDGPPKSKAQQREDATIEAGREALRLIKAAKEGHTNGPGYSGGGSSHKAGSGIGRAAYPVEDCRVR